MLVLPVIRASLAAHAVYYTFIGIAFLTFPSDVPEMFYLDDKEPKEPATGWPTDLEYPMQRYSGSILISLEAFIIMCAYINTVQAYIGAFIAIQPYHISIIIMSIITENTLMTIVNGAIIGYSAFILL
eukprot:6203275-Pleurochrysis_carterae.AAC.1